MIRFFLAVTCCAAVSLSLAVEGDTASTDYLTSLSRISLPAENAEFTSAVEVLVRKMGLDVMTAADRNPDKEDEYASICVVDLSGGLARPVVAGWNADNYVYPASAYKMYVLGEAIRQVCAGERSLDDLTTVSEINDRRSDLKAGAVVPLAEVLRLMCTYSDNTAANVAIDVVDRRRATLMLHALGCKGSDITRKFLPRNREPEEFTSAPATTSCARHFATFLYAVEASAIGGGRGRALIKGYLGMNLQNGRRIGGGLPATASLYSKTGEWSSFTAEAGIVEDGDLKYIVCILAPYRQRDAEPKIAGFVRELHTLIAQRNASQVR